MDCYQYCVFCDRGSVHDVSNRVERVCSAMIGEKHRLHCYTCKKFESPPDLKGWYGYCTHEKERELTLDEIKLHERLGCASHSNSQESLLDILEQWHYDEINRIKLHRAGDQSMARPMSVIKTHEISIKRINELRRSLGACGES